MLLDLSWRIPQHFVPQTFARNWQNKDEWASLHSRSKFSLSINVLPHLSPLLLSEKAQFSNQEAGGLEKHRAQNWNSPCQVPHLPCWHPHALSPWPPRPLGSSYKTVYSITSRSRISTLGQEILKAENFMWLSCDLELINTGGLNT